MIEEERIIELRVALEEISERVKQGPPRRRDGPMMSALAQLRTIGEVAEQALINDNAKEPS